MPAITNTDAKIFLANLPAIFQEDAQGDTLRRFLSAFEQVLLGQESEPKHHGARTAKSYFDVLSGKGLGEKIARLHRLFDPRETPERFLPWLASWAALSVRANLGVTKQRKLIANIIPLYAIRGTRAYMERLLALCVDAGTSVSEDEIPPMQLGVHSTLGEDTYIGGGPPHFFRVTMAAAEMGALEVQAQRQIAYEVIELAKPAHTVYDFVVISPEMQIGVHSTVGVDTVLGAAAAQLP